MANGNERGGTSATVQFNSNEVGHSEPVDEHVTLRDRNGTEHVAKVTCGSFSSLAATVAHGDFAAGDSIEAEYGGATIPATVRRAYKQPDGQWLVLLRWGQ